MKNKMMKTAGLFLASTTMLMASGVIADTTKDSKVTTFTSQDGTLEIKVMERDSVKNKEDSISSFEKFEKMMKREGYEVIARHPSDKKAIVFEKDGERMSIHYKDI